MKIRILLTYRVNIRILVWVILLWPGSLLTAQTHDVIEIKNIPEQGILLNNGWKYQPGDNPEWAKEDYNDNDWKSIDPTPDIHELPVLWKDSIVWFRLHLNIDSARIGNLAMMVAHAGASEFYLNGRLIKHFGVVSKTPGEIAAFNPYKKPLSFPVNKAGTNILAVRYVLEPGIKYTTEWANENPGLSVTLNSFENANIIYDKTKGYDIKNLAARIAAYVFLAILYLAFYIFNRRQKTSLYFFIYAFIWAVVWGVFYIAGNLLVLRYLFYMSNIILVLQVTGWLFCVAAIYELLGHKKTWIFYALLLLGIISIPMGIFIYGWGWSIFAGVFITLASIDIARVAIVAGIKKRKGSSIMITGSVLCLILWVMFILSNNINLSDSINPWFLFSLHHLSLPVAISIYIGYDLALTNQSLEQKLVEVQALSTEKNQLLSSQNEMLEKQVSERTAELQQSLNDLTATQKQLIQSEKMASLGELTAGIAHEIQNPLNFVNNFSEVSGELIKEMVEEVDKGNTEEVKAIAKDLVQNLEKINNHGKRADAIVKGMLQHSQSSSGVKEPTDINKLADEYLRLAYHGLKAKDKTFNATLKTDFDETIGDINIIPQDIGRVVLNLLTNAFYAVQQKQKETAEGLPTFQKLATLYEPTVSVSTRKAGDKVSISIKDNGNGIPQKIVDKIFQPFFTTKPTGQGTGLGLSLSYDIVKAHGGEIKVDTKEGEGTTFSITL